MVKFNYDKDHPKVQSLKKFINENRKEKSKTIGGKIFGKKKPMTDEEAKKLADVIETRTSKRVSKTEGSFKIGGMLSPKQKKIAAKAPPRNKIDGKDFAVLKAEKAKGRGQGLQDEKMKPGKVMKAAEGKSVLGEANKPPKSPRSLLGGRGGPASLNAKQYRKYLKGLKAVGKFPGIRTAGALKQSMKDASKAGVKGFLERRAKLAGTTVKGIGRAAKATRIGKIAGAVAALGLGAKAMLNKKSKEAKEKKKKSVMEGDIKGSIKPYVKKKMGGGMMKKPMGYSEGTFMDDIIENMGKDYDYQTRIKYRKKSKGAPDQDPMKAYSEAEVDAAKSVKKKYTGKMGGGMMMRRPMMANIGAIAGKEGKKRLMSARDKAEKRAIKRLANAPKGGNRDRAKDVVKGLGGYMGGGMMQRPMMAMGGGMMPGYKKGKSVMAKGCKLGRKKPTKMYT